MQAHRRVRAILIALVCGFAIQAYARTTTTEQAASKSPRVRIGLKLTEFRKETAKKQDGKTKVRFVKDKVVQQTLRARIDQDNHFFVGDWHIETKPITWVRKSRRYRVRLDLYRRYGAFGQLEEKVGTLDVPGVLEPENDGLFVLTGAAHARFRDKFGNPVLDVIAGRGKVDGKQPVVSQARPKPSFREAPKDSSDPYIRGRF